MEWTITDRDGREHVFSGVRVEKLSFVGPLRTIEVVSFTREGAPLANFFNPRKLIGWSFMERR